MPASFGVKRTKGCDCAPAIGQVAWVGMGKRDGGGAEVECGACKDSREILSKLGAVVVKERGRVDEVVGKKFWCPSCKTTCGSMSKYMHIYGDQYLLLVNLAMRMKAVDSRISLRISVFAGVLTKLLGTCSSSAIIQKACRRALTF